MQTKNNRTLASYVNSCITCIHHKSNRSKNWGVLRPFPVLDTPWKMISVDFDVELLPSDGFAIFVVVDRFYKMAHFLPMKGVPSAMETA